jgi:hypothetical protein
MYVNASAVSAIEIPDWGKPLYPKTSKTPVHNFCRDERVKATIHPASTANISPEFRVTKTPEEVKKLIDDMQVTQ